MKCGTNKFCVGFEENKVYCYGANNGCLWGQNTCTTDEDCKKYNTNSLKYTDGDTPGCPASGWRNDACIPILINGIDLASMVKGGTYSTKKSIGYLTDLPNGNNPSTSWVYPTPFGIDVNGADICNNYEALYYEYTSSSSGSFPSWCTSFKVICIGGGKGGDGWTAGVFCRDSPCQPAYAGNNGSAGGTSSGTGTASGTYTINIGSGGAGGAPGVEFRANNSDRTSKNGKLTYGKPGSNGAPSSFSCPGFNLSSATSTNNSGVPSIGGYGAGGAGGNGGPGGAGGNGYCRVYFFR